MKKNILNYYVMCNTLITFVLLINLNRNLSFPKGQKSMTDEHKKLLLNSRPIPNSKTVLIN